MRGGGRSGDGKGTAALPWLLAALVVLIGSFSAAPSVHACRQVEHYEPLPAAAVHPLDWQVYSARESHEQGQSAWLLDPTGCSATSVVALKHSVRSALAAGGHVVLGEVHDNPHHHHVRAFLLPDRVGDAPPLIFEHIRTDQQPLLDATRGGPVARDAGALLDALGWDGSGWPPKMIFVPLFQRALDLGLPILAGHPPRESLRAMARGGSDPVTVAERRRLRLDETLSPPLQAALLLELEASHCGLVPASVFGGMALAQRYRDAHMAAALIEASRGGGAMLFTGNGHVRTDRGVPFDIARLAPGRSAMTVLLVETEAARTDPASYVSRDPDGRPAVDYVLFAPGIERQDPCIAMREQFGRRK